MLTALTLANFKPFSTPQRIDFAPLSLLTGPNGSGKSSILHALLYLRALVTHGTPDVDRITVAGSVIELGGFSRLVHRHESHRAIVLRAELTTPRSLERATHSLECFPFPDLDDDVCSAWIELTVRHRITPAFRGAVIDRVVIGVNDSPEPLVWLEAGASLAEGEPILARVNLGHPILASAGLEVAEAWHALAVPEHTLPPSRSRDVDDLDDDTSYATIARNHLALPDDRPLPVFAITCDRRGALPSIHAPLHVLSPGSATTAHEIRTFLEMVVLGTTAQLAAALQSALHVGPYRTAPPPGLLDPQPHHASSYTEPLDAWARLLGGRAQLVTHTNAWLDRLGAGGRVVVQQLFDPTGSAEALSVRHVDRTARRLLVDTPTRAVVLPCEAGASFSQVLPVVVAALDARLGLVEQPEAYVHPAYHEALGDLFVATALHEGKPSTMLVETHSEALMQRVLACVAVSHDLDDDAPVLSPDRVSVLHVDHGPEGARVRSEQPWSDSSRVTASSSSLGKQSRPARAFTTRPSAASSTSPRAAASTSR